MVPGGGGERIVRVNCACITRHGIRMGIVVGLGLVAAAFTTALAKDGKAAPAMKPVTVEGVLVDTKCHGMSNDNSPYDHTTPKGTMPGCGTACANMGIPVGLLVDGKKGGKVYVLLAPSKALADYVGETARITGMKALGEGNLLPEKAEVKGKDGKYTEIKLTTMM